MDKESNDDRLKDVPADSDEEPQVYALRRQGGAYGLDRRSFWKSLGLGSVGAAAGSQAQAQEGASAAACGDAKAHAKPVSAVAIGPDAKLLATSDEDGLVKLWDIPSGKLLSELKGHQGDVGAVAFGARGDLLVTAGADKSIRFWSLPEGKLLKALSGHTGWIHALAI